jgi:hypothetical protein
VLYLLDEHSDNANNQHFMFFLMNHMRSIENYNFLWERGVNHESWAHFPIEMHNAQKVSPVPKSRLCREKTLKYSVVISNTLCKEMSLFIPYFFKTRNGMSRRDRGGFLVHCAICMQCCRV